MVKIAIVDFVSKYSDQVGKAFEDLGVEYRFFAYDVKIQDVEEYDGLVFTGSPDTVYEGGKLPDPSLLECGKPIFGICYGHQLFHHLLGGEVKRSKTPEEAIVTIEVRDCELFRGLPRIQKVVMNHNDEVVTMADGFTCTASEDNCLIAASEDPERKMYSVQFHPEAEGNDCGIEIFRNFVRILEDEKNKIDQYRSGTDVYDQRLFDKGSAER